MFKRKISLVTISMAALVFAGCNGESRDAAKREAAAEPADLVLRGGKVVTVDPALGTQQALAVDGYEIAAVGSDEEIAAYIGPATRVIELNGRFVMPGFIEGHGHFMGLGRSRQILDLTAVRNWDEVVAMVAAAVDQAQPGEWIFGRGWHQDKWDSVPVDAIDGVPVNDSLSAVSADNPVLLEHASGHASFANDAALAAASIDDETADPEGGTIVRTSQGEATGLLRETAQRLLNEAVNQYNAQLPPEQAGQLRRQQVQLAGEEALQHGVTSFHDAGESFETIGFFRQLEQESALPLRLYVMVRGETIEDMDQALPQYKMLAEGNDFLVVRSIKVQIDGALGSHGAWLLEPYTDMPESTGLVLEPVADVERTAEIAVKHGFQLCTHAIGTRANREVLDLYQRVWQRTGADGAALRWRIEHAQHLDAADVPRFAQLGVIAAMQGVHATSDGPWIPSRLGEERGGATSYIWRDLLAAGTTIGNGTDVPVERIDPIASFYSSVSRMMPNGKRFHPEQIMTREEALKSYTVNNAFAAFEESVKGTLSPGKLADIVVLSQDLLTVPEAELPETRVDMTIVGGEVRYDRLQQ